MFHAIRTCHRRKAHALRAVVAAGLLAALMAGPGAPADEQRHDFSDPKAWAERWEGGERRQWQRPVEVLRLAGFRGGESVADLGVGTGLFARPLSALVDESGKVYIVDVEQAMLDHVMAREDILLDNLIPVLAEPDDPKLPEGELDAILCVNTYHHIGDRVNYLRRLARSLKPGGRMVLVDFRGGELPVGPPEAERVPRDRAVEEFRKAGWKLIGESVALPYQYYLVFSPDSSRATKKR